MLGQKPGSGNCYQLCSDKPGHRTMRKNDPDIVKRLGRICIFVFNKLKIEQREKLSQEKKRVLL